ncbi:restriction endonuclease subunit S [Streptomyces sp. N2A]|uniref:restriction endonuclease subunit S n=1 Tax=Streptomyces sp. N2A TaxID=3073936 RepID=UPI0028701020|nr:restriction endonuclease subunit S [Streptomyces sp. N2A]
MGSSGSWAMSAESNHVLWVPVGEAGEVRMGKQLSPASSREDGAHFPYLRVANVLDGWIDYSDVKTMSFGPLERCRYELMPGDILLNEGQSLELVGRSAIYKEKPGRFFFQNTLIRFRSGSDVLPEYAQTIFTAWQGDGTFASIAKKTTSIAHLGGDRFSKLLFPIIPLERQRRIVEILECHAESERASRVAITKLRSIRRGVALAGMGAIGASCPSGGWQRVPLGEVVPSVDYGISVALNADPGGIPTLRMNNIRDGRPDLIDLRYCPQGVNSRLLLRVGDVLFNRTNSIEHVGRAGIWNGELEKATFASYLVRLNPDTRRIAPRYLVEWLQHPVIRQRVRSIATVAVQQVNVNPSRLRELEIDLPIDLSVQNELVSSLEACDRQISAELENLAKIRTMKQGLTAALLGGRLAGRTT